MLDSIQLEHDVWQAWHIFLPTSMASFSMSSELSVDVISLLPLQVSFDSESDFWRNKWKHYNKLQPNITPWFTAFVESQHASTSFKILVPDVSKRKILKLMQSSHINLTLRGAGPDFMLGCTQVLLQQYLGLWSGSNFMQQQSAEIQPLPTVWPSSIHLSLF